MSEALGQLHGKLETMEELLRKGELAAVVERAVMRAMSPHKDRKAAAAYLHRSLRFVDRLLAEGRVSRQFVGDSPLIRVDELDRVIAEDTKRKLQNQAPHAKQIVAP